MKKELWIDGKYIPTKEVFDVKSPYNGEVLATVASASREHVQKAIQAAAQSATIMKKLPAYQRAEILEKVALLIKEEKEECARLIAQEAAKPIKAARAEVERTIMTYTFAANEARRIHGETVPLDGAPGGEDRLAFTIREPLGVIAAITPFNFPMNLVAHKVGPAIAAGNSIVLKPASQTPLSSYKIAEYFQRAGLPEGALNVVTGSGKLIGDELTSSELVNMVTFTGSPEVGKYIRSQSGLKKVTLELGSNSAVIIDKGVDVQKIIPRLVMGAFAYQGQVCISIQRIFVHEEMYDEFIKVFVEATAKLVKGDPLDESTDLSALISPLDVDRTQSWVDRSIEYGAELLCGGDSKNGIYEPTILAHVPLEMEISCEEVFAPVVHVNTFSHFDEAVSLVNQSKYGLQAGIFTKDVHHALKGAKALHVGGVMINDIPTFRVDNMPYGGVKLSGMGREGIKYAVEEMTEMKLISFKME